MRRSPRKREKALAIAARKAYWITEIHQPAVEIAKTLARTIDDMVYAAESAPGLFAEAPLADQSGNVTYIGSVLVQYLDRLGMTPTGQRQLGLEEKADEFDALAEIINLAQ